MSGPHFGKIPRRVSTLRLARRDHAVLDVIACHADREGRAWLCRETIAREAGIDRSKVSLCVGRLEDRGVLDVVRGGGRGRANRYRIISDEEALRRRATQAAAQTDAAAAEAAVNGAASGTPTATGNGAVFGSETVPFLAVNGAVSGTPTEIERNLEQNLPFGEGRARTSEEEVLRSRSGGGRQTALLLPLNGTKAPSAAGTDPFEVFRAPPEIVAIAQDLGIDDVDSVVEDWKDWHRKDNKPYPANPDASLRRWVRNQPRFARGSPKSGRSSLMKAALEEAETDD